jgi:hypothetical protein
MATGTVDEVSDDDGAVLEANELAEVEGLKT